MARTDEKSICPLCFNIWPIEYARKGYGECPDCGSEAIGVDLVPLNQFLKDETLESLRALLAKWDKATGFYESYKQAKRKRIEAVIRMKESDVSS
jgi:hypothetical protein